MRGAVCDQRAEGDGVATRLRNKIKAVRRLEEKSSQMKLIME
jgi:hypothetical protein